MLNNQILYLWHYQAPEFLAKFAQALNQPNLNPVLFNIWGMAGVGKTTLLERIEIDYERQANSISITFGVTEGIDTILNFMAKIYAELNKQIYIPSSDRENLFTQPSSFISVYQEYQQTLERLKNIPVTGKVLVEPEQLDLVKLAVRSSLYGWRSPQLQQILQQHPATADRPDLQELMLAPLPRLTQAFTESLHQKAEIPIVLALDNYDRASPDINIWLREHLLASSNWQSEYKIRIVVASRRCLLDQKPWQQLQRDRDLIYQLPLNEFNKEQTRVYLQQNFPLQPFELQQIYRITKGLPYYLNWIRCEREAGKEVNFFRSQQTIAHLLLHNFNSSQKQVLQLAACCRWFNRALIRNLLNDRELRFHAIVDENVDWFEWLIQCNFIELFAGHYCLNDAVRDVLRLSLLQNDRELFYRIHAWLANYFERLANREVAPDRAVIIKYENPDWCQYTSEYLYYSLFARTTDVQVNFISHLFASYYFDRSHLVQVPYLAIASELNENHSLLSHETRKFLSRIAPAIEFGWLVLEANPIDFETLAGYGFEPSQIEVTLQTCDFYVTSLNGLAKFAALLYKSRRCLPHERLELLLLALEEGKQIADVTAPEFSSNLFAGELATALYSLGCYQAAIVCYEKALAFQPENDTIWWKRGMALYKLEHYEQAIASYNQALKLHPQQEEFWYNRGLALRKLKLYAEAIESYQRAIELQPNRADFWNSYGIAMRKIGRLDEAMYCYNKAIELNPNNPNSWYNRGIALDDLSAYTEALVSYDRVLELAPNDCETWYNRGITLRKLRRYEEALASYEKALEFNILDASAWYNRGYVLDELERYEEAIASYDKALEIEPDDFSTWYNRALALRQLERHEEAIASFERAIELQPNKHKAWYNQGLALRELGRLDEAIFSLNKATELQPSDPSIWYNKACCYALQGNLDLALTNLEQAINLSPNECREMASTDPDFNSLRTNPKFQDLINASF